MKKKGSFSTILLVLIFMAGLSLLLYPYVSNYWNSTRSTKVIASYAEAVAGIDKEQYEKMYMDAVAYNQALAQSKCSFALNDDQLAQYESLLDISGVGIMGYIEIESLDVRLPIYHGTSDGVLQIAVGHVDWTSLPVGGLSTHCVLSGHRGLPSAKLFTDLDQLVVGDVFTIRVLDEILTYEVDQILIVEPQDTSDLQIVNGKDYCTLVTCTPYGINTHRLLVRGHRIENAEQAAVVHVTAEAVQIEPMLVASLVGVPTLMLLLIMSLFGSNKKKGSKRGGKNR